MYQVKKLLSATTLAMTLGAVALAGPAQGADGVVPYDPYGSAGPTLVPDGVGVFERRGSRVAFNAIDATASRQTTLARARLDPRVDVEGDDSDANAATSATHAVVSFASEGSNLREGRELRLGGTVQAGPLDGPQTVIHSCAGETDPAPVAIDGSLVAAAQRTTCSPRPYGDEPRFDVVARDLSAGAHVVHTQVGRRRSVALRASVR